MTGARRGRGGGGRGSPPGRVRREQVKTAAGRPVSSTRWLSRQLNDPYVAEARRRGYRSRAAFKLAQIDDRVPLLRRGARVLDLGAAPGGWSQIAHERVGPRGRVVAIDLAEIAPLPGVVVLRGDARDAQTLGEIQAALGGPADVVLCDMAAPATGHARTDHLRVMALAETALEIAEAVLAPGGGFVAKVLQGGAEGELLARLKARFAKVRHVKPAASRAESAELYLVASGYRGAGGAPADTPR